MLATLGCLVNTTLFNKIKQNQPILKKLLAGSKKWQKLVLMNTFGCADHCPLTFVLCVFTEGSLAIVERNRKDRERYAFLFDNMLIMCKPTSQRPEYKFKEKLLIKHIDVTDIEDSDGKIVSYPIIQWLFPEGNYCLPLVLLMPYSLPSYVETSKPLRREL